MLIRRSLAAVTLLSLAAATLGSTAHSRVAAAAQTTVTYWTHVNAPAQKVERKLISQFEAKNPNIKINYVVVDFNSLPTKLTTALAGGAGPDIFNYFRSFAPALVQRELIAPVDFKAFGVANQKAFTDRYVPSVIGGYTFGNTIYGVPHEVSNFAFWVNGAQFKAAGLDPVKDFPKTWADVVRLGKKTDHHQERQGGSGRHIAAALQRGPRHAHPRFHGPSGGWWAIQRGRQEGNVE